MVVADHLGNVDDLAAAAREGGGGLAVTAALDVGGHRIGAANTDAALAVARRIDEAGSLAFAGIHAYAGPLQHIEDYGERRRRAEDVSAMVGELQEKLDAAGIAPPLVSGAGTGTHDIDALHGPFTELQVGSYIFTDVQYDAVALREDTPKPFEPALFVRITVVSTNVGGQVTTDGGLKRFASDGPPPEIASGAPDGARYEFKGDEHGRVVFAKDGDGLPLGAAVECLTPPLRPHGQPLRLLSRGARRYPGRHLAGGRARRDLRAGTTQPIARAAFIVCARANPLAGVRDPYP